MLGRLRGENGGEVEGEWSGVVEEVEVESKNSGVQNYVTMFSGTGEGSEWLHIGRRVQLVIWLQVMQEWIGIAGVTVYAPTIFRIAGIGNGDSGWVSGLNNTVYMVSMPFFPSTLHGHSEMILSWCNFINKSIVLHPHLRLHP